MVMGKVNQAYRYINKHGMLDLALNDEQFINIDTPTGVALSEKFKKGKSSTSKKASTVAKAASPSQELEIVEITPSPSPKASSKKASTHAKAASDLEIVELSPSPQKKHPLSFGEQVAAKLLEQQSDKSKKVPAAFKPAPFKSLPTVKLPDSQKDAGNIENLHKSLVKSKGKAVSPTFKPYKPKDGDWMW